MNNSELEHKIIQLVDRQFKGLYKMSDKGYQDSLQMIAEQVAQLFHQEVIEMKFVCNYCPTELPHFKALLEHIHEKHPEKLRRFEVKNGKLGQVLLSHGESAEQLCEANDWDIKDCKIRRLDV